MRKIWSLPLLLVLAGVMAEYSHARMIGTNPTGASADIQCLGGRLTGGNTAVAKTEVCLDSSGNWIPTTNNSQQLGTSSMQYNDVETAAVNRSGNNLNIQTGTSGNVSIGVIGTNSAAGTGNATGPSTLTNIGSLVMQPVNIGGAQGIYISSTIPILSSYETINSSGNAIVITATPSVSTNTAGAGSSALTDGTILVLSSTGTHTITVQDNGTLAGSGLDLGATTRAFGNHKTLTLIWNASLALWTELSYANNQ